MTSPPLRSAATFTADNAQPSIGNQLTRAEKIDLAMREVDLSYPLTYSDRVGEEAIREEARRIRNALGWEPRTVNKLVMGRDKIPIHIDDDLADRLFIFLAMEADMKPTNTGKGFRASQKKITPAAVTFGDRNSSEGSTETPKKEYR